jgi:hypothetical protein
MLYKAKVAVCSDIRTKHSKQSERHVEFLNVKPWWYIKKPLLFKRLTKLEYGQQISVKSPIQHFKKNHLVGAELLCVDRNDKT